MVSRRLPVPLRRSRFSTLPVVVACFAGGLFLGTLLMLKTPVFQTKISSDPASARKSETVNVPVPVRPVAAGTPLKQIALKFVAFPVEQVPVGALLNTIDQADAVALVALPAEQPLLAVNFSGPGAGTNAVIERIPPGMRAMTVKVDATSAVEGWAGSGSIVDLLLVEKNRTSVIAEGVKILSAERTVSPVEGNAAPNVPSTVTLLVTQEQCLAINTAIPLGRIAFALRGSSDPDNWERSVFTSSNLKLAGRDGEPSDIKVRGVITMREGEAERAFALAGDKWIPTDVVPDGFRLAARH